MSAWAIIFLAQTLFSARSKRYLCRFLLTGSSTAPIFEKANHCHSLQLLLSNRPFAPQTQATQTEAAASPPGASATVASEDLAPGTALWLIQRMSVTTKTGVIGISPGSKVTVIKDNSPTITVSDGTDTFDVPRTQLTTDPAIAQSAATADYASQVALAKAEEKQMAETNRVAAKEAEAQAGIEHAKETAKREKEMAKNAKLIIGHVRYAMNGGLVVDCIGAEAGRPVASSLARIGAGGGVGGPSGPAPEVEGTILLTGYPKQAGKADGDSIHVRAYEVGVSQMSDGSRVHQYQFVSGQ
jgi:hypothetical protein